MTSEASCFLAPPVPADPEWGPTPGVEAHRPGPLGQGFSNAVGMAIAERILAAKFNTSSRTVIDHYTYVLASDGDMMEGVASEAASIAGHLKLGKPIAFYDSNQITIEASTTLAFSEDVLKRYEGILDTTGTVTTPDSNALSGVLFTADNFSYWVTPTNDSLLAWAASTNAGMTIVSTHPQSLRGFPDGVINGDYFRHLIRAMLWFLMPIGWLLLVLFGMLSCLLQAYLFSVVASFMERSMPAPLQLSQLLNIAIYACTPAAIVVTLYSTMRLHNLNLWLVYLIVYGIFLIGASMACRDPVEGRRPRADDLL